MPEASLLLSLCFLLALLASAAASEVPRTPGAGEIPRRPSPLPGGAPDRLLNATATMMDATHWRYTVLERCCWHCCYCCVFQLASDVLRGRAKRRPRVQKQQQQLRLELHRPCGTIVAATLPRGRKRWCLTTASWVHFHKHRLQLHNTVLLSLIVQRADRRSGRGEKGLAVGASGTKQRQQGQAGGVKIASFIWADGTAALWQNKLRGGEGRGGCTV